VARQQTASAGIDTDIDLNFEAGLSTRVNHVSNVTGCGLILSFQFRFLRLDPLDALAGGDGV
jgi:hypothetical protein